jgi:hypothetical protein
MRPVRTVLVLAFALLSARNSHAASGILLLAHGGSVEWNARVSELAAKVNGTRPTEVITSTEYLLGLRSQAPAALASYAKMNHGPAASASSAAAGHEGHGPAADGTVPVRSPVPVRMTPALNDHPIVAEILTSHARANSRNQTNEAVIVVAHGPTEDDDNVRWLADMRAIAERIKQNEQFPSIGYLTLRDDASKPVRDAATTHLRGLVQRELSVGRRVLIAPLLISFGGFEKGLRERLEGLAYTLAEARSCPTRGWRHVCWRWPIDASGNHWQATTVSGNRAPTTGRPLSSARTTLVSLQFSNRIAGDDESRQVRSSLRDKTTMPQW